MKSETISQEMSIFLATERTPQLFFCHACFQTSLPDYRFKVLVILDTFSYHCRKWIYNARQKSILSAKDIM